jgi:putative ABC transport system permease protein
MGDRLKWLFKMAWRDSRRSRSRLFLFISSIILGVGALVAIRTFGDNLQQDIDEQAKTIIGADLSINLNRPFPDHIVQLMDSLGGDQSSEISFASMVYFPKSQGTRLVQVRALEGGFPYYGAIETDPVPAADEFQSARSALVDQTLLLQFASAPGDTVKVGELTFDIAGRLFRVPGGTGITATVAPPVYIPMEYLEATGLIKKGSRIRYHRYFKFGPEVNVEEMLEGIREQLEIENINYSTVELTKENLGSSFEDLTRFLSFVAFAALLLGCIGVASSVHIYVKEKLDTVAVLRCIGSSGSQSLWIYLIQILTMGLIGSIIGAALGSVLQLLLPTVFSDFLPIEISLSISWSAIIAGVVIGVIISVLFALLPLLTVRKVSPTNGQQR